MTRVAGATAIAAAVGDERALRFSLDEVLFERVTYVQRAYADGACQWRERVVALRNNNIAEDSELCVGGMDICS